MIAIKNFLLISTLAICASCNGQNKGGENKTIVKSAAKLVGEPVWDIGKNLCYLFQDKEGVYWIASNGEGVFRFDGQSLTQLTKKHGLNSDFVLSIQEDANGKLWFTTREGFCSYDEASFTDYTLMIRNAPRGKLQYAKGGIFFGHLDGICYYNGRTFTNFDIHPENYRPSPTDMNRPYSIYSTLADSAGIVWFGTQSEGVGRYDGNTYSYLKEKSLAGPAVRTIFQDSKGRLWFGNNGGGLFQFDGKTLTNITEEKGLGNPEFLRGEPKDKPGSLARVWTINEDREGNIWIGTIDAGAWKFDGTSWTNYTTTEGLAGNSIWKIFRDRSNELLFITNGDAINKFDGKTFTRYSFKQGLIR